jgi:DNA primase
MLVDDIKNRIDILELANAEGLQVNKSKKVNQVKCCFHKEQNNSLTFYRETQSFFCFGCNTGGDSIAFYAKRHNLSNKEAVLELAKKLGIKGENKGKTNAYFIGEKGFKKISDLLGTTLPVEDKNPATGQNRALKLKIKGNPKHADLVYRALREFSGDLDKESYTYLNKGRGLTDETIKAFGIFSIKDYQKTKDFLISQFSLPILKKLLLVDSKNRFSFTKNKIIIPVINDGKIVALRGRFFDKGNSNPELIKTPRYTYPKYKSTAEIWGRYFNSDILKTLSKGEKIYLTEGEFDTMTLTQKKVKVIGLMGVNNYSEEMIKQLKDFDLEVILDNDEAGRENAKKICSIFYSITGRRAKRNIALEKSGDKDLNEYYNK